MAGELHGHHGPDMAPHLRRAEVERMTVAELARAIEARGGTAPKKARKAELVAIVVAAEKEEAHHDG
jgi:hypothetical protein